MKPLRVFVASMLCVLLGSASIAGLALADESEWELNGETLAELSLAEEEVQDSSKPVSLVLASFGVKIECKESKGGGDVFKGGYAELVVQLKSCAIPKAPSCKVGEPLVVEVKSELLYAKGVYYEKFSVHKEKSSLATVTLSGEACALPEKTQVTGSFAAQTSLEESKELPEKFSETITKTVNTALGEEKEAELKLSFGKGTAYFEGEFVLVPPSPASVHRVPKSKLCELKVHVCTLEKAYEAGTFIDATRAIVPLFKLSIGPEEISCAQSDFEMITEGVFAAPILAQMAEFTFEQCDGGCTVEARAGSVEFYTAGGPGNGKMVLVDPVFEISCELFCVYRRGIIRYDMTGGVSATFTALGPATLERSGGSEAGCPDPLVWTGFTGAAMSYTSTGPNNLYVTG